MQVQAPRSACVGRGVVQRGVRQSDAVCARGGRRLPRIPPCCRRRRCRRHRCRPGRCRPRLPPPPAGRGRAAAAFRPDCPDRPQRWHGFRKNGVNGLRTAELEDREVRAEMSRSRVKTLAVALSLTAFVVTTAAQTPVVAPKNKYTPADDVKLGQQAAQEVEKEMPLMRDEQVNVYLNVIGRRLAESIPSEFRHPEFRYTFTGVNLKDINAFALPGGPMFVNRGMIEAAQRRRGRRRHGARVQPRRAAPRHGAGRPRRRRIRSGRLRADPGRHRRRHSGRPSGKAPGSARHLVPEVQPRIREAGRHRRRRIMAAAGYDPRDMANMFKTIEQQCGPADRSA